MTSKPLIGVSGPDRGGLAAWLFTRFALRRAGARAIRITPSNRRAITACEGFVLGGGADVSPKLYGQAHFQLPSKAERQDRSTWLLLRDAMLFPITWTARRVLESKQARRLDLARDDLEYSVIERALSAKLPVLGICRGEQLINVYFGGTLHQELSSLYVEEPVIRSVFPKKRIVVEPESLLARSLAAESLYVNALHQQAVNCLGDEIYCCAKDKNGIIQAVEHRSLPYMLGVQWHPEYMPQSEHQLSLFRKLVETASSRSG